MTQRPVRYGVIGFGLAGSTFHAPLIATTPGAELAVIVARPGPAADRAAASYPDVDVIGDIGQLTGRVDAAVVATPNPTHAGIAEQLIGMGIAALVDKPIATEAASAERMISLAEEAGVVLTCYQNRRWDGDFLTAQALIKEGALGRVHRFESRFERWRPNVKQGWKERPSPGAGVVFDLGPHLIDQAIHLFGPPESWFCNVRTVRDGAEVPDEALFELNHAGGVVSLLTLSLLAPTDLRFRVVGDHAAYTKNGLDPQEDDLRAGRTPQDRSAWGAEPEDRWGRLVRGESVTVVPTLNGDYPRFYEELTRSLVEGTPPPVDPRDSLAALRIIEAAGTR